MQLRQFEERENSKAVWMNEPELEHLLDQTDGEHQRFALGLMARSGLRVSEAIAVRAEDLIKTDAGLMVRVWAGKGDKYREAPVAQETYWLGQALERGQAPILRAAKRTVQSWVERAAGVLDELLRVSQTPAAAPFLHISRIYCPLSRCRYP